MPTLSPFSPQTGSITGTVNIIASTGTANVQLPPGGGTQLRLLNTASLQTYVAFGASTVTVSTGWGMPLAANMVVPEKVTVDTFYNAGSVGNQMGYMAAIASVTTTLPIYVTRGEGF